MKNIDYVIKKTAADLGLSEKEVRPVVMEYWRGHTANIIKFKATTSSVRYVGNFTVSRFKLYNYIRRIIGKIRRMRKITTISEEKRLAALSGYENDLRIALRERNILAVHYQKMFNKDAKDEGLSEGS